MNSAGPCMPSARRITSWPGPSLIQKPKFALVRAVTEFQIESGPMRPSAFDRELAELMRRIHSLIRRFVRAGTGLHGAEIEDAAARNPE